MKPLILGVFQFLGPNGTFGAVWQSDRDTLTWIVVHHSAGPSRF